MSNKDREWKVGDMYMVIDYGLRLWGTIIKIDAAGYHVKWSDGRETVEDKPDPAQSGRGY